MLHYASQETWYRPIGGIIPRSCNFTQYGDFSLRGTGGYCHHYQFFFFIQWTISVQRLTVLHMRSPRIFINDLECATSILLVAEICLAEITDSSKSRFSQPYIQYFIDNTAESWIKTSNVLSLIAQSLKSVLCALLTSHSSITVNLK